MPKITFVCIFLLLLTACGTNSSYEQNLPELDNQVTEENEKDPVGESTSEEESATEEPFEFFMPDASTATFLGEGNEYASFTLRTVYLDDEHIATYEDNGGTVTLKVYRISDNAVELVKEQAEFYEEFTTSSEELEALEPIRTYLRFPLEVGMVIDDWAVTEKNANVETPFENFENVIVLENEEAENILNKTYFVEGYGEVKREFRMQEEGQDEFVVTSVLESIEME